MLRKSWCFLDCAEWKISLGWERLHGTLIAACLERFNHACLTLQTFRATVDQKSTHLRVPILIKINELVNHGVDPASGLHVIKPTDDDHELLVEICVQLLDVIEVILDVDPGTTLHYGLGGYLCFVLVEVLLSGGSQMERELT